MSHTDECLWNAIERVADMVSSLQENKLILGKQYNSADAANEKLKQYQTESSTMKQTIADYNKSIQQWNTSLTATRKANELAKKQNQKESDTKILETNIENTKKALEAAKALKTSLDATIDVMKKYYSAHAKIEKDRKELESQQSKLDSLENEYEKKERAFQSVR